MVITSSHNPWNWNGVKFKAKFGGSAPPAIMKVISEETAAGSMPNGNRAAIEEVDLKPAYIKAICAFADIELIRKAQLQVRNRFHVRRRARRADADLQRTANIEFVAIRQELNPLFPGINPEPIEPHVRMLQEIVVREKCHAGFATDGDADRIGAVAEDGSFVDAHKIFCVLLRMAAAPQAVVRRGRPRFQYHAHA